MIYLNVKICLLIFQEPQNANISSMTDHGILSLFIALPLCLSLFFIFVLFCALQHQVASTALHNGLQTLPPDQGNATQYPLNGSHFQLLLPRRAFGAAERGRPGTLSVQNNFEQSELHSSLHLTLE